MTTARKSCADRTLPPLLLVFAAYELITGLLLWLAPGYFFLHVGPYDGVRNEHYMADNGGWYLALAAGTAVAVARPRWRAPVLAVSLIQNVLHLLSHLLDVGESDPGWHGPLDAALLAGSAVTLAWMLAVATRGASPSGLTSAPARDVAADRPRARTGRAASSR
jgi:hypothetical protein